MKDFNLFYGASGDAVGTFNVTNNPKYELVVETVKQLRQRLIDNPTLREPILALFTNVYQDNSKFPEDLKENAPVSDHRSNQEKIQEIRPHPPSDDDVIYFLKNSFPDIYLDLESFTPVDEDFLWGMTKSGRSEGEKELVTINVRLVNLWLAVSFQCVCI